MSANKVMLDSDYPFESASGYEGTCRYDSDNAPGQSLSGYVRVG
jgi:hypothetical protein